MLLSKMTSIVLKLALIIAPALLAPALMPIPAKAVEIARLASADPAFAVLQLSGPIERGDARKFEAAIRQEQAGAAVVVRLASAGGDIAEAIELGRLFHRHRIRTYVTGAGTTCAGACAIAFLGGRDQASGAAYRVKGSEARIVLEGFRVRPGRSELTIADMQAAMAGTQNLILAITDYLVEIGAGLDVLDAALAAPGGPGGALSDQRASALGILVMDDKTGRLVAKP